MTLNLTKTKEKVVRGRASKPIPSQIVRVPQLNLPGLTFQEDPCNWDLQIDSLLAKASCRLCILRVCRFYQYPKDQISKLFDSLILSLTFVEFGTLRIKGNIFIVLTNLLHGKERHSLTTILIKILHTYITQI